jgi:hypothetical protein
VELARTAHDREKSLRLSVPPAWPTPTSHLLGALLLRKGGRDSIEEARDVYADSLWHLPNDGWCLFGQLEVCKARARFENHNEEACVAESLAFSDAWTTADIFLVDSATVKPQFNTLFASVVIGLSFACGAGLICVFITCTIDKFGASVDSGATVKPLEEQRLAE